MSTSRKEAFPRFEDPKGSDLTLIGVFIGSILIQLIIVFLVRELISETGVFWIDYAIWALICFAFLTRRIDPKARYRPMGLVLAILLIGTLVLSNTSPVIRTFNLSFEGYVLGASFYVLGMILKRHI